MNPNEPPENPRLDALRQILKDAQYICPPDDFALKQRKLLWALAQFVIEKEENFYEKKEEE